MKKSLKKTLSTSSIVLAVVLSILIVLFISAYSKRGAFSQFNIWTGNEEIVKAQNQDSDDDGLNDWQENLFKTDVNNSDTDGDTYLDGEEVNSGHNPLIKSPGDEQVFYPLPLGEKYNITKKLLSDENIDSLFTSYLTQKTEYVNEHSTIDSQEKFMASVDLATIRDMWKYALGETFSGLTEQAEEEILEMPDIFNITITDNDIKISDDNSREAIILYLDKVSSFLNSDTFFLQEKIANAVRLAAEQGDFSQLDNLIQKNDAKIEELKTIAVPSTWKEIHKKGFGLTLLTRNIYVSFRDLLNDPVKAYIATEKLEKSLNSWIELTENAINLSVNQGIKIPLQK